MSWLLALLRSMDGTDVSSLFVLIQFFGYMAQAGKKEISHIWLLNQSIVCFNTMIGIIVASLIHDYHVLFTVHYEVPTQDFPISAIRQIC